MLMQNTKRKKERNRVNSFLQFEKIQSSPVNGGDFFCALIVSAIKEAELIIFNHY